jgi:hypothetical protein
MTAAMKRQGDTTESTFRGLFSYTPLLNRLQPGRRTSRQCDPMFHTTSIIVRPSLVLLSLSLLGCGSDLVLPDDTGSAAESVALTKVNGDEQQGTVGDKLGSPLIVRVLNQQQQGVGGLTVTFAVADPAGGTVDPASATTNSAGEAVSYWTLGTVPGPYTVVAGLTGLEGDDKVAEFHALAGAGTPVAMAAQTPLDQPGRRQQTVQTAPVVLVTDRYGNPVPGTPITWQVIAGEGNASPGLSETGSDGKATTVWTLGDRIGIHKLTATAEGLTGGVTFKANVLF